MFCVSMSHCLGGFRSIYHSSNHWNCDFYQYFSQGKTTESPSSSDYQSWGGGPVPWIIWQEGLLKFKLLTFNFKVVVSSISIIIVHIKTLKKKKKKLQGAPLSCLSFGPVRFGTSSTKTVVLSNSGPLACDWVCVLQLSLAGTEVVSDVIKSCSS